MIFAFILTVAVASQASISPVDKSALALQLIQAHQLDKSIESSIQSAGQNVEMVPKAKDAKQALELKIKYGQAKAKFQTIKPVITKDTLNKLNQLLTAKFSAAELQYLITVAKNPLIRRMQVLRESPEFISAMDTPFNYVSDILVEASKKDSPETLKPTGKHK